MSEEFILLDVCRGTRALGLGCRADSPEAIRVGLEIEMQGNRVTGAGEPAEDGDLITKGYADRTYGGGSSGLRLLWENASPNSNFGAQTVPLDLSGFRFVIVTARYNTSTDVYGTEACPVGMQGQCKVLSAGNIAGRNYQVSPEGITFQTGFQGTSSKASFAIPLQIYGM